MKVTIYKKQGSAGHKNLGRADLQKAGQTCEKQDAWPPYLYVYLFSSLFFAFWDVSSLAANSNK
jgi:hypothetical protein